MGSSGGSSSAQNYNSQSTTYQTNTKDEHNVITTNENKQMGDSVT